MTKTVLDIDGKECFFNENDTICEGYTYIDIYQKLCRTRNPSPILVQTTKLQHITLYSSFLDDPALGQLDSANPDTINISGNNISQRMENLKRVRSHRQHYAAGGDGSYENPITAATSKTKGQLDSYENEVGNIYWIPYIKKYIIIEDINSSNSKTSSLDLWAGAIDMCSNKIQYYDNSYGNTIVINIYNKKVKYSMCGSSCISATIGGSTKIYNNWTSNNFGKEKVTFIKDLQKYYNDSESLKKINRYIYINLALMSHSTQQTINPHGKPYINYVNAYLTNDKEFILKNDDDIIKQPLINFQFDNWDASGSPNMKISDDTIDTFIKNLLKSPHPDDIIYQPHYTSETTGIFCEKCFDDSKKDAKCPCDLTTGLPGHFP